MCIRDRFPTVAATGAATCSYPRPLTRGPDPAWSRCMDDEGIKQLGKNLWAVRVKRISAATGRTTNRKATVTGSKADARHKRDELRAELVALVSRVCLAAG